MPFAVMYVEASWQMDDIWYFLAHLQLFDSYESHLSIQLDR